MRTLEFRVLIRVDENQNKIGRTLDPQEMAGDISSAIQQHDEVMGLLPWPHRVDHIMTEYLGEK